MTLDEAIKHAEEVAEEQDKAAKEWHENQIRKCACISITEMDYTRENECKRCAEEHQQLADWLKDYKRLLEQTRWIPVSERLPEIDTTHGCNASDVVLVCLIDRKRHMGFYCDDTKWRFCDSGEAKEPFWEDVVEWMPLPESYKAESEEV